MKEGAVVVEGEAAVVVEGEAEVVVEEGKEDQGLLIMSGIGKQT